MISEPLILKLERIIEALDLAGHDVDTLTVMSGYRTPFYNEGIGNVRDSQHTAGTAADIFVDENDRRPHGRSRPRRRGHPRRRDLAVPADRRDGSHAGGAASSGGLGDYGSTAAHGPFVHVDVRGRLARWRG